MPAILCYYRTDWHKIIYPVWDRLAGNYTGPCVGQRLGTKTISCPESYTRIGRIRENPSALWFPKFFGICSRFRLWVIYQLLPIKSKYVVEKLQSYSRVDCEKPVVDRFYHARAVRDLSTFITKSYETCPFYVKLTKSSILLHTSLAVLFSESVKSKVLQRLTQHSYA